MDEAPESGIDDDDAIRHRLESDLRYASSVDRRDGARLAIARVNPTNGLPELITYDFSEAGVTRQRNNDQAQFMLREQATAHFQTIVTSAPAEAEAPKYARIRSSSRNATVAESTSLTLAMPPGCGKGDVLLVAVAGRAQAAPQISVEGWTVFEDARFSEASLLCAYLAYEDSLAPEIEISSESTASLSAIAVAVERSTSSAPITWTSVAKNIGMPPNVGSPVELVAPNQLTGRLNVQIIAAAGTPWQMIPFGMPGYVEMLPLVAADAFPNSTVSLLIATRSASGGFTESPRGSLYGVSSEWIQVGCQLEVKQ